MADSPFASHRGCNSEETVQFINERLGATGLGTHIISVDYPFMFVNGARSRRHKGMRVSETGCRAIYSTIKPPGESLGRAVEAAAYRESCSGRVVVVYHNDVSHFSATNFTLIPESGYTKKN